MTPATQTTRTTDVTFAPTSTVVEIALQRLQESPLKALGDIQCQFRDGRLILTGRVPTFYTKQIAQTLLQDLDGVEVIDNQLFVRH